MACNNFDYTDKTKELFSKPSCLEGYESPITMFVHNNTTKILEEREDAIVARISEEIGLDIDKEELIKALKYDRNQYSKGYDEGYRRARAMFERPQGEWKETGYETGALGITYRQTQCSNCGWEHALPMWWNFCPNCGASMQKGDTE